ncbi:MAG: hypothetical protein ACYTHJ_23205 [Planctomycetota bacterium]
MNSITNIGNSISYPAAAPAIVPFKPVNHGAGQDTNIAPSSKSGSGNDPNAGVTFNPKAFQSALQVGEVDHAFESKNPASPFPTASTLPADVMEKVSLHLAKTNAIKAEIAAGTYESSERIAGTVDRLLDILA